MILKLISVFQQPLKFAFFCFAGLIIQNKIIAQATLSLADLSAFKQASSSWQIAGDVKADIATANLLIPSNGTGILVNAPNNKNTKADLYTSLQHGDADLELDYMMAKESNSGIYLQGRYEIQLFDSWGVLQAKASDNGGVYERWDESRSKGNEGYEGYAPRQNVSKAPGLWQHLKISFQAPRFDNNGKKTENAKILRIELNGVLIHENVELFGVTRGGTEPEAATGPLRFQGDHGAIAFRNIKLTNYDKPRPELVNLKYSVYKGMFEKEPDYGKLPPEAQGSSVVLSANLNDLPDSFTLHYTGILKVKEAGDYAFNLSTAAGTGILKINNQLVPSPRRGAPAKLTLPAGDLPFDLSYSKFLDWAKPSIGLAVAGPGIREYIISDANNLSGEEVDPILIDAPVNTLLRSFIDIPEGRVTHAVSVGSADGVHYTYDMDKGALVQIWRGGFLDATPMWHERGDGSSRARGSIQRFGKPVLNIARLDGPAAWKTDTAGTGYRPKGYKLDEKDRPVFRYMIYGATVNDAIQVLENRGGISREITVQNLPGNFVIRIAEGKNIEDLGNGLYLLDDKSYYLKMDDTGGEKTFIRDSNGRKELLIPIKAKIKYSVLF